MADTLVYLCAFVAFILSFSAYAQISLQLQYISDSLSVDNSHFDTHFVWIVVICHLLISQNLWFIIYKSHCCHKTLDIDGLIVMYFMQNS